MKKPLSLLLFAAVSVGGCGAGLASPVGLWLAKDGAKIRISPCGGHLCGFFAQTSPQIDPATGRALTDKNNIDPAKRNRPLVGVQNLIGMQPDGPGNWTGKLYNDDDGKTYIGKLIEVDASTIRIEGCVGAVCGGDLLTRLK